MTLTIFGTGLSSLLGQKVVGQSVPESIKNFFSPARVPLLGDIPYIGQIFFNHDLFVYLSYIITIIIGIYLYKTTTGLNLKAVGENPDTADAASINVSLYKYINIYIGGLLQA